MTSHYTVADYLLDRLAEIGIRHLFGVPGDFNLHFLDHVISHPVIKWVGCANELNAAYAADGYARVMPAAALLTTSGVGELSAINGIAGSFTEYLPVIHIVGTPTLRSQKNGELLHHSLGDGNFSHFSHMAKEVTCAQANLTADNAAYEIDRVLGAALSQRRPVYLSLPSDVAQTDIAIYQGTLALPQPVLSPTALQAFINAAREKLQSAHRVALLADFLADRFDMQLSLNRWLAEVNLPHSTLLLGKGVLDETHPLFIGTYAGAASEPHVKECIENADVLITVGVCFADIITAGFSQNINQDNCISIQPEQARIGRTCFSQIPMRAAIEALHELCKTLQDEWQQPVITRPERAEPKSDVLDQQAFWYHIQQFLRPNDLVLTDLGTSCFGAGTLNLPSGCTYMSQALWESIGFSLPAAYGAQLAQPQRRLILLVGDGAAQLTIQELGSMLRDGLNPIIFLLNNQGYTVERAIHGPQQRYNDIATWNWTQLPLALGLGKESFTHRVTKVQQLQQVLAQIEKPQKLTFIEVVLPPMDIPELLMHVTKSIQRRNVA
ncbi:MULTISPECIES: alpha-keto acid decarboxylase family protein [Yersinia]|jgi:indolepyruvate decarboxylase|nr:MULTISPECIES: thiamine pyrophosphate-binding protein [Yersinia]HEC1651302.1 indolepyruvate decarboxylase [Yersinia enterocolitica]QKJ12136.1 indolepyruvate decarboxylase [Yersinia massiliensis]CFR16014.1 indole-3-pyruvate decarboxylase [Yersinia frederiksenii]CNG83452.1 indole-3-pyruvate decarboxylase [Yersinia frederiksenii]CNK67078.1 indole-3-pyruvate decarboxylase [Yersinia frederiksenii]